MAIHIGRREFITLLGGAAAPPHNRSRADLEAAELNAALGDSYMTHPQR